MVRNKRKTGGWPLVYRSSVGNISRLAPKGKTGRLITIKRDRRGFIASVSGGLLDYVSQL